MLELGVDNFYIELIEQCPCNSKEELRSVEGKHIREIGTLNKQIAGRTQKEYYEDNKEEWTMRCRERYENNKENIFEKCQIYKQEHKE